MSIESSSVPSVDVAPPSRRDIALALRDVRERTLDLIAPLSEDALTRQHDPLMSPIVWDLGHIGAFEELWLVRRPGEVTSEAELDEVYDAFRTPRSARGDLDLPRPAAVLERMAAMRSETLARLAEADLGSANPLLGGGFAWEMVRQHEAQHQETILQTIMLMSSEPYEPARRRDEGEVTGAAPPPPVVTTGAPHVMIRVQAGPFDMGASAAGFAYDNERPRRRVHVDAFEIGRYPVTNAEYVEFIAAGGYTDRRLWTDEGWAWTREAGFAAPMYWVPAASEEPPAPEEARELSRDDGVRGWVRRTSLGSEPLPADFPVIHVCCHEAEAFARFASARLPTEAEWEKAAAWDPDARDPRIYPWGDETPTPRLANLDQLAFGPSRLGSRPLGRSAVGCEGLLGDVWEWTSSTFGPYGGFEAFPYPEYSEVFFGPEYRVLRGGSWATRPAVARNTFRNWDYPIRRQIFAGLRLARDA
jgi:iron(II)-dependent oxidoreductase